MGSTEASVHPQEATKDGLAFIFLQRESEDYYLGDWDPSLKSISFLHSCRNCAMVFDL